MSIKWIMIQSEGCDPSYFRINPNGELTETVDTLPDGGPDWDNEGFCCPFTGDADLQGWLIANLTEVQS